MRSLLATSTGRRRAVLGCLILVLATGIWKVAEHRDSSSLDTSASGSTQVASSPTGLIGHHGSAGAQTWTAWPQALHDAQHSDAGTVAGPRTGHVRWSRRLEGDVTPGPVVARDGSVLVASNAGVLHALDQSNGRDRWTVDGGASYGSDLSTSAAVLPDGLVLWPGPQGRLWAISGRGKVLWRLPSQSGSQFTSPAVTAAGVVVVGDVSGGLIALRPARTDPGVRWGVDLGDTSYGSAVWAADGRTAYQSTTAGVVAVRDGTVQWRATAPTEIIEVSPAVAPDGTVVVGTNDPYEYGFDPKDGRVKWRHHRGAWTYSSPGVTRDGIVCFGDHRNRIRGLDALNGRRLFYFEGSQEDTNVGGIGIWTSIVVDADHNVCAGTRQGLIYGVDRSGKLLWQLKTGATVDSYPALTADGALLVGISDHRLLAIGDSL